VREIISARQADKTPITHPPPRIAHGRNTYKIFQQKKWALTHLNLPEDGVLLGEAIRSGQAKAVSDGSFKEKFGTATWVFYHASMNATLGSGKLITLGYPEDQCTYRSELSGLYGIVSTIRELTTYQDLAGGTILITCDGENALH